MAETSGLAEFLENLFQDYKTDRNPEELVWRNCANVVKGVVTQTWKAEEAEGWRSKTEIKLVKAKIYAAFAMILDVFLQGGDIPFNLKKSPFQPAEDAYKKDVEAAIDEMTDLIKEQLRDRKADRHYIKKILSMAYYGLAWSKYNTAKVRKQFYVPTGEADERGMPTNFKLELTEDDVPGHEYRSVWCMYTDPEDGDLQNNQGTFELTYTSPFELRKKIGEPGYIDENINKVISEYQKESTGDQEGLSPGKAQVSKRRKKIPNKEFWGRAPETLIRQFMQDIKSKDYHGEIIYTDTGTFEEAENIGKEVEFMGEMAGTEIIRIFPIEPGERVYKRCFWEDLLDEDIGIGIAENLEGIQNVLTGMVRAFEDNKRLSANVITAKKSRYLAPGQDNVIKPGMDIEIAEACDDVRKALMPIIFPDVGESLLSGIDLMLSFADKVGQIPEIIQGFNLPKHKTDTLGEINWLMENAGKYLGMVIRNMDESFVEPEINDIYTYNMEYLDGPKVSCKVHATGFSSFQNKAVLQQKMRMLLALVTSSEVLLAEVKIRPHLDKIYKAMDLDTDEFLKSEEEKQEEAESQEELEQAAKDEAEEALKKQTEIETQAKVTELKAKAQIESKQQEEEFQRDLILEGLKDAGKVREPK